MNQPITPVVASRAPALTESPDVLGIARRYAWLLIAGTAVGAAIAGGLHVYFFRYNPSYTAKILFRVSPPPAPIGGAQDNTVQWSTDEASTLIHGQMLTFEQQNFLTDIIRSDEFQKDYKHPDDSHLKSAWLTTYTANPLKQLKKDLVITPKVNAASFELSMTSEDPYEAFTLVKAAAKVYLDKLKTDSSAQIARRLSGLQSAMTKQEKELQVSNDALQDWAKAKGIDVARSRITIEQAALQGLNQDHTRADALAAAAELEYMNIKAQQDAGQAVRLSPDMSAYVENDFELRTLENTLLALDQERAAAMSQVPPNPASVRAIDARTDKINEQVKTIREKLVKDATQRMIQKSQEDADNLRKQADYIGKLRQDKEDEVKNIGNELLSYQQKLDDLKQQQDRLYKTKDQFSVADLNRSTDDTRVQQVEEPAVPTEVAWPQWYTFMPLGTLGGFSLSFLLAYVLVLSDTRVRTPRDITRTLQLPMLGFVPDSGDDRTLGGAVETAILSSPASMVAESFRQIRSQLTAQTAHSPVNTLLVASIAPGGGATTVAANLAASMALNDLRVLLVDTNFYRPGLPNVFDIVPANGLADVLTGGNSLSTAIVAHPSLPKLHLLGAGSELNGVSSEMFESKAFRDLLEQLKSKYDLVIFDGAPLSLVSDSLALASRVDGVIPVVRAGEVSRGAVSRVRDQLRGVHANLLGFVLNAAQVSNTGYFKENYRTFYRYAGKGARRPSATASRG